MDKKSGLSAASASKSEAQSEHGQTLVADAANASSLNESSLPMTSDKKSNLTESTLTTTAEV